MPFSIDQGADAGLDQRETGLDLLTAMAGDTLAYAASDAGRDLECDGPGGPGTLRLSLRPWTPYTVGDGNLTADLAARLLQDGVCVKA